MTFNVTSTPPVDWQGDIEGRRQLALTIQRLADGKLNSTGTLTLTANTTTTNISDRRIGPNSVILFMPTTANGAAEIPFLFVSNRGKYTATVTHQNTAATDKSFAYAVIG